MCKIRSFLFVLCVAICGVFLLFHQKCYASAVQFHKAIYHVHTGGSGGGGCYSVSHTGTREINVPCGGTLHYWPDLDTSQCSNCGASYHGNAGGRDCWHSTTRTESYTYYSLGCGKGTDTLVGNLYMEKSTDEWVKELTLTGSFDVTGGMSVSDKPYIWNSADATANNVYTVNSNGVYTLKLNADANAGTGGAVISADIRNIDVTSPTVSAHSAEPESDWTRDGVRITLTDVADLQPDGTAGCGLHENAFSYDEGDSWTSDNSYLYMKNGVHRIWVRDSLENTTVYEVEFYNVDCTPPTLHSIAYDETKNIPGVELVTDAIDLQPDGSEGIGLHEKPYSYDGGQTWMDENKLSLSTNQTISLVVRDKLLNEVRKEIVIDNIDCYGPAISYRMESESWTNRDVKLFLSAKDLHSDGTPGAGLPQQWYSLDGGSSWSDAPVCIYQENCSIHVLARDVLGNTSSLHLKIVQIDKDLPWVTLEKRVTGEGKDRVVELIATAGDDDSGLPEEAYSWNKGCSYGTESTMEVKENGTYQVTVRDKAGNWNYALIEVEEFAFLDILPILPKPSKKITNEEAATEEETTTEEETAITEVTQETLVAEPESVQIKQLKRPSILSRVLFCLLILFLIALLFLLFFLWYRCVLLYNEDEGEYLLAGILWIGKKDEMYVTKLSEKDLSRCVTTNLMLKPGALFVHFHKGERLNLLLPEEQGLVLPINREIYVNIM